MKDEVKLVQSGTSVRKAAIIKGVSKSALQRYVKKWRESLEDEKKLVKFVPNCSCRKIFTDEEEEAFVCI